MIPRTRRRCTGKRRSTNERGSRAGSRYRLLTRDLRLCDEASATAACRDIARLARRSFAERHASSSLASERPACRAGRIAPQRFADSAARPNDVAIPGCRRLLRQLAGSHAATPPSPAAAARNSRSTWSSCASTTASTRAALHRELHIQPRQATERRVVGRIHAWHLSPARGLRRPTRAGGAVAPDSRRRRQLTQGQPARSVARAATTDRPRGSPAGRRLGRHSDAADEFRSRRGRGCTRAPRTGPSRPPDRPTRRAHRFDAALQPPADTRTSIAGARERAAAKSCPNMRRVLSWWRNGGACGAHTTSGSKARMR